MIALEDSVADVIGKAQRGLGVSDSQVADRAGVSIEQVRAARDGNANREVLTKIAAVLQLDGAALGGLASYQPPRISIDGLAMFNTHYGDMTVNAYLVWDPRSRAAIAFDTGANCSPVLGKVDDQKLDVQLILLTHSHPDHVADLAKLRSTTGAPIYISNRESATGANGIEDGREFTVGRLRVRSLLTWGHSRGGMTYYITGLEKPLAIVGDAVFAGSMGGGNVSYTDALQTNRDKIFTLPDETIICPGHGPLTTVGSEKAHNPFFAAEFRAKSPDSSQ